MKTKIILALFCAIIWPAFAFCTGMIEAEQIGFLSIGGTALAALPALIVLPESRAALDDLIECRRSLIDQQDEILEAPAETRGEGDDAEQVLSQEQRDRLAQIDKDLRSLDKRIETEKRRERRKAEQAELEKRQRQPRNPRLIPDVYSGPSDGDRRSIAQFSLARACRSLVARINGKGDLDGIEAEMAQEGEAEARASGIEVKDGGIMISRMALSEQRDLSVTGGFNGDRGGMTVATSKGNLLDSLFDSLNVRGLGATVYDGLVGNLDITRMVEGSDPAGKAENAQSDEYEPTMADLNLSPNRLPTYVDVSKQLFIQSAERSLQSFLERHITSKLSVLMEKAFINGSGSAEAEGILQTSGIGAVIGETDGAAIIWEHIVKLVEEVDVDNALIGNLAYYTNPKVVSKLKRTPLAVDGSGDALDSMFILPQNDGGRLNDYNYVRSNAVPSDLSKGTAIGIASAIIFGNWIDYVIAQWSGIELLADPFTQAGLGKNRIHAAVYYDGGVQRPASFAAMQDALTA